MRRGADIGLLSAAVSGLLAAWLTLVCAVAAAVLLGGRAEKSTNNVRESADINANGAETTIEDETSCNPLRVVIEELNLKFVIGNPQPNSTTAAQNCPSDSATNHQNNQSGPDAGELDETLAQLLRSRLLAAADLCQHERPCDIDYRGHIGFNSEEFKVEEEPLQSKIKQIGESIGNKSGVVLVLGFADSCGLPAGNLNLSEMRAQAVAEQLREGLSDASMLVLGMGEGTGKFDNGKCSSEWERNARSVHVLQITSRQ